MEKKQIKLAALAADAKKNAGAFIDKTRETVIRAVDQNDDGKFDFKDVTAIADAISNTAKQTTAAIKETSAAKALETERRQLQPLFDEDIDASAFSMSKLIRIAEIDKKHAESEVCKGSIGFTSTAKDFTVINVFKETIGAFNISVSPDTDSEFYYVDPTDRDHYIAMEEYFKYLQIMRVNELEKIAQDLGAKHFRVTFKEKRAHSKATEVKGKLAAKRLATAEGEHHAFAAETQTLNIAAECDFPGHDPIMPTLKYLAKDPAVRGLINLRMNGDVTHKTLEISFSNTSGIKEKDAVKIDAVLNAMKFSGSLSVANEVKNETNRFFEYEIDF